MNRAFDIVALVVVVGGGKGAAGRLGGGVGTLEHFVAGASGIGEKVQRGALNGVRKIP